MHINLFFRLSFRHSFSIPFLCLFQLYWFPFQTEASNGWVWLHWDKNLVTKAGGCGNWPTGCYYYYILS